MRVSRSRNFDRKLRNAFKPNFALLTLFELRLLDERAQLTLQKCANQGGRAKKIRSVSRMVENHREMQKDGENLLLQLERRSPFSLHYQTFLPACEQTICVQTTTTKIFNVYHSRVPSSH